MSPDGGVRALEVSAEVSLTVFGLNIVILVIEISLSLSCLFSRDAAGVVFVGSVELEGILSVLGLIKVALGIVGSLAYYESDEVMVLTGTITYSVDTFLGGPSGCLPIGRTEIDLSGGPGGASAARLRAAPAPGSLSFGDRYRAADWNEYTVAFV